MRQPLFYTIRTVAVSALALISSTAAFAAPVTLAEPLDSRSAATKECSFGNMLADAVLAAAPGADFAIAPAAEIKPTLIDAGKTTTERIADSLRASTDPTDTVVVVRLTGAQVRSAIAHGLSRAPEPFDGFLMVSGLAVHYDTSKSGDARVTGATITRTGEALQPKATYKVAMTDYLSDGALGYFSVWPNPGADADTHMPVTDAVTRFALANQPVTYRAEGRISGS